MARSFLIAFSCTCLLNSNEEEQSWHEQALQSLGLYTSGPSVVSAFPYLMLFHLENECLYFYMIASVARCGHFYSYVKKKKSSSCARSWNSSDPLKFIVRLKEECYYPGLAFVDASWSCKLNLSHVLVCTSWYVKNLFFLMKARVGMMNKDWKTQTKQPSLKHTGRRCTCVHTSGIMSLVSQLI